MPCNIVYDAYMLACMGACTVDQGASSHSILIMSKLVDIQLT